MKNKTLNLLLALSLLSTLNYPLSTAHAQGTAFAYQGRLNDGTWLLPPPVGCAAEELLQRLDGLGPLQEHGRIRRYVRKNAVHGAQLLQGDGGSSCGACAPDSQDHRARPTRTAATHLWFSIARIQ